MRWRLLLCMLLLTTQAAALTVKLAWDPPAVGVPETYVLYRKIGTGQYELLATIPVPTLTYTDNTAVLGSNCYQVTASNSGGESLPSNIACFQGQTAPGPPQALRIIP